MTTTTATTAIEEYVQEWIDRLNAAEVERRVKVNADHRAKYGRDLYPDGGQYATFSLGRPGRKFTRIVMEAGGQQSVHAFVDLRTGDVYKAAGWKAPAAGVRFVLTDDDSRADMFARMAFSGGYLYR